MINFAQPCRTKPTASAHIHSLSLFFSISLSHTHTQTHGHTLTNADTLINTLIYTFAKHTLTLEIEYLPL